MQNFLTSCDQSVASIGAEIGLKVGTQFIQNHLKKFPASTNTFIIGKEIIKSILSQPLCEGVAMIDAINERGDKTLVYHGVDCQGAALLEYSFILENGEVVHQPGIVADRVVMKPLPIPRISDDQDWGWTID